MIAAALARSLGTWADRARAIADVVTGGRRGLDALEASVRGAGREITGGRMMIDRLDAASAQAILSALPVPIARAEVLLAFTDVASFIVGWDTGRAEPVAKIYVNLSDAARDVRVQVAAALSTAGAPHVVGFNFSADLLERKLYHQLGALPDDAPAALVRLADEMPLAGVVRSFDVRGGAEHEPRATFVAPRADAATIDRLAFLPGWDAAAFEAALPFAPGSVRSVGFARDGASWMVYVRPAGIASDLWSLEPTVCLRSARGEIGIYVAPIVEGAREYARTAQSALSYRVRAGDPSTHEIEAAMHWAIRVLSESERTVPRAVPRWADPPRGLRVIEH